MITTNIAIPPNAKTYKYVHRDGIKDSKFLVDTYLPLLHLEKII